MTIHISRKNKYKRGDSYNKKMRYTTTIFGGNWKTYQDLKKDKYIKDNFVVWYTNGDI